MGSTCPCVGSVLHPQSQRAVSVLLQRAAFLILELLQSGVQHTCREVTAIFVTAGCKCAAQRAVGSPTLQVSKARFHEAWSNLG